MVKEVTEVVRCDICGDSPAKRLGFAYERRMDAAGSMENVYYDIDLCVLHKYEVHRIIGTCDQSMKQKLRFMSRSERWDLRLKIEGIRRAWRKMPAKEQELMKQILRLGVEE